MPISSYEPEMLDRQEQPLDISGADLQWMLRDPNGKLLDELIIASSIAVVRNVSPDTLVRVDVPRLETAQLGCGRFFDAFRVSFAGEPDTVAVGMILGQRGCMGTTE